MKKRTNQVAGRASWRSRSLSGGRLPVLRRPRGSRVHAVWRPSDWRSSPAHTGLWWRHPGPRVTDTRVQDICIFIPSLMERPEFTADPSGVWHRAILIWLTIKLIRVSLCLFFNVSLEGGCWLTPWDSGGAGGSHRGRGGGDRVGWAGRCWQCNLYFSDAASEICLWLKAGPGHGNRLTREKTCILTAAEMKV